MICIQQEFVTLKFCGAYLGFYWPFGFDQVMVGSVHPNPKTSVQIFDGLVSAQLMSVEEAHELFTKLMDAGAY